jgi:hypothetical protein
MLFVLHPRLHQLHLTSCDGIMLFVLHPRLHQLHLTSCDSGPAWYFYAAIGLLGASLMACTYTTQLPTAKVSTWLLYESVLHCSMLRSYVEWKWDAVLYHRLHQLHVQHCGSGLSPAVEKDSLICINLQQLGC